jgi:hypothetical protein
MNELEFSVLVGKTIAEVRHSADEIKFICTDGSEYQQYHVSDCCESVTVEDICGDLNDITGAPVLSAEVVTSAENPPDIKKEYQDSFTWTFYKIQTQKGAVTIRWYGSSNGYYSESVDFVQTKEASQSNQQ